VSGGCQTKGKTGGVKKIEGEISNSLARVDKHGAEPEKKCRSRKKGVQTEREKQAHMYQQKKKYSPSHMWQMTGSAKPAKATKGRKKKNEKRRVSLRTSGDAAERTKTQLE